MSAVLQRLQSVLGDPLSQSNGLNPIWQLSGKLALKDENFFRPWLKQLLRESMRYHVICMELAHAFARKDNAAKQFSEKEADALTKLLIDALAMAEFLTYLYTFINDLREIDRLKSEQEVYRFKQS